MPGIIYDQGMRRLSTGVLTAIGIILAFNPVYVLMTLVLGGYLPNAALIGLKYLPFVLLVAGLAVAAVWRWRVVGRPGWRDAPHEIQVAVALLGWCMLNIAWSSASVWQSMRGLNVDFAGVLLFVTIWLLRPKLVWEGRLRWVMLATLGGLLVLAIPESLWNQAFRLWSRHDLAIHYVVQTIPQLRSLTSGPNPFGTLMVLLAGILALLVAGRRSKPAWLLPALMVPVGLCLGLTYARSAWIGGAVGIGGYFVYRLWHDKRFVVWPVVLGLAILAGASFGATRYHEGVWNVLTHGKSTEEHAQIAKEAADEAYRQTLASTLFGHGLGTAGPVVFGTKAGASGDVGSQVAESWYIQLFQEIGIIGLALYCWLYVAMTRRLFRFHLFVGWLAVGLAFNAITLHTWSADVNVNVMFWTLAALTLYASGRGRPATPELP